MFDLLPYSTMAQQLAIPIGTLQHTESVIRTGSASYSRQLCPSRGRQGNCNALTAQKSAHTSLHLPPIQPPRNQATLPQLEQLTSLLRTIRPAPARTPFPETPSKGDRPIITLKSVAVPPDDPSSKTPEVSTTTARLTSCALNNLDAPGNNLWSLTLSDRLLNLLKKYSKNSHPRSDDFKDAQNLYRCPVCKRGFV